jgi:hypothetical protein
MTTLTAPRRTHRDRFADWLVIGLVIVSLAAGWLIKSNAESASQSISGDAGSFSYPIGWLSNKADGVHATDTHTDSSVPTTFGLTAETVDADQDLKALSTRQTIRLAQDLDGFSMLSTKSESVNGEPAVTLAYAYVVVPDVGLASSNRLPVVVEATDTLIKHGDKLYVLRFSADSAAFAALADLRAKLVNSVKLP